MAKSKILVVEDEIEIRQLIALHLRREGYAVVEAGDGDAALTELEQNDFNLVVLDWMLPVRTGLEITRSMRQQRKCDRTSILFVTAKNQPEHIATGLDAGADDYLAKPFDTLVLMARVNALLRRNAWLTDAPAPGAASELRMGDLVLFPESHESLFRGKKIELTRSEFRLLEALVENQGKVLSRETLIEKIQGEGVNVVGRTIDTHVFGLRKKLEDHSDYIETIRGVGYRVRFPNQLNRMPGVSDVSPVTPEQEL